MTTVVTIPQTTVPAGQGSVVSGTLASSASQYVATLTQVGWPFAGDKAFDYTADCSLDGGSTWTPCSQGDVYDAPLKDKAGNPTTTFKLVCSLPGVGNANRKLRLTWNFAKQLTISGIVEAQ